MKYEERSKKYKRDSDKLKREIKEESESSRRDFEGYSKGLLDSAKRESGARAMSRATQGSGKGMWDVVGESLQRKRDEMAVKRDAKRQQPKKGINERISGLGKGVIGGAKGVGGAGRKVGGAFKKAYQKGPGGLFNFDILHLLKWLFFLILIVLLVLFLWRGVVTGDIETFFLENIYEPIANSKLWQTLQFGYEAFLNPVSPQEIWYGEVDEHVDTRLGVYINRFEPYQREFSEEDNVILFADIDVYGFADYIEELKTLRVSCELNNFVAEVFPPGEYRLLPFESYSPECRFGSYHALGITGRSAVATFNAAYDFNTKGYLKVYFVDDEEKRSLLSKGIDDVFGQYNIDEVSPIKSVYTAGPVEIALSLGGGERIQPVGLVKEGNNKFLGITIRNKWEGKINKINNLTLRLPEGVRLKLDNQDTCPFGEGKKIGNFNEHKLSYGEEIDTFKTFRCFVKINYEILEGSLKQEYYQFEADYEYGAEKKTVVVFLVEDALDPNIDINLPNLGSIFSGNYVLPVSSTNIVSCYGVRSGPTSYHEGIDFTVPVNTQVKSVDSGKIIKLCSGHCGGYGNYLQVDHGGGLVTQYGHLSKHLVKEGDQVIKGQPIGLSGGKPGTFGAGISTGPHLDLKFIQNGKKQNPLCYLSESSLNLPSGCCSCESTKNKKAGCYR